MAEINETVRALSWKQPYASLMLPPFNKIETRTWGTKYRGLVLICASKQGYRLQQILNISGSNQYNRIIDSFNQMSRAEISATGCGIAIGRLVDSRPMVKTDEDKCFVEYHPDLFCHIYEDVKPIHPMPWIGTQGWRTLTPDEIALIKFI